MPRPVKDQCISSKSVRLTARPSGALVPHRRAASQAFSVLDTSMPRRSRRSMMLLFVQLERGISNHGLLASPNQNRVLPRRGTRRRRRTLRVCVEPHSARADPSARCSGGVWLLCQRRSQFARKTWATRRAPSPANLVCVLTQCGVAQEELKSIYSVPSLSVTPKSRLTHSKPHRKARITSSWSARERSFSVI
jgi:hypothetical protein